MPLATKYPAALLALYLTLGGVVLFAWMHTAPMQVDGDEQHYLVMASGLAHHGTFENTLAYQDEFRSREIYARGLQPPGTFPTWPTSFVIRGPHGLYNLHPVGLPILLALPFLLGGVLGAKIFMLVIGAGVVLMAWRISGDFCRPEETRFAIVASLTLGLPLLPASHQIYPDVLAGLICLAVLHRLSGSERSSRSTYIFHACLLAFLPWLKLKFAAPALVLALAHFLLGARRTRLAVVVLLAVLASLVGLAAFNVYAYGDPSGPYSRGSLEFSLTALMVFLGLHFDQNQGFLIQNPLLWIGLASVAELFRRSRSTAVVWVLTYAALIVPNAMHPNWYGGLSFSGRFQWSAGILFVLPTILGLSWIAERRRRIFRVTLAGAAALQLFYAYGYAVVGVSLYNRLVLPGAAGLWHDYYSIFFPPSVSRWLPELYDVRAAYRFGPNIAFTALALGVIGTSFAHRGGFSRREYALAVGFGAVLVLAGGLAGTVT